MCFLQHFGVFPLRPLQKFEVFDVDVLPTCTSGETSGYFTYLNHWLISIFRVDFPSSSLGVSVSKPVEKAEYHCESSRNVSVSVHCS